MKWIFVIVFSFMSIILWSNSMHILEKEVAYVKLSYSQKTSVPISAKMNSLHASSTDEEEESADDGSFWAEVLLYVVAYPFSIGHAYAATRAYSLDSSKENYDRYTSSWGVFVGSTLCVLFSYAIPISVSVLYFSSGKDGFFAGAVGFSAISIIYCITSIAAFAMLADSSVNHERYTDYYNDSVIGTAISSGALWAVSSLLSIAFWIGSGIISSTSFSLNTSSDDEIIVTPGFGMMSIKF